MPEVRKKTQRARQASRYAGRLLRINTSEATDWTVHLLMIVSVPAVMHGLYDTLLKKGFDGYALAVALASFVWLALMLERARSSDKEYTRRGVVPAAA